MLKKFSNISFTNFMANIRKLKKKKQKNILFNPYFADLCGSGSETLDKS